MHEKTTSFSFSGTRRRRLQPLHNPGLEAVDFCLEILEMGRVGDRVVRGPLLLLEKRRRRVVSLEVLLLERCLTVQALGSDIGLLLLRHEPLQALGPHLWLLELVLELVLLVLERHMPLQALGRHLWLLELMLLLVLVPLLRERYMPLQAL